jgi:threonine 3-dehydrogenase
MRNEMKAIVKTIAGPGAELTTVDIPSPGPQEVLIQVTATSICCTDLHIYRWDPWAAGRIKPPLIFGHELAGEVVDIGEDVTSVAIGEFVSAETHVVCGVCHQCRSGQQHICQNVSIIGVDRPGCFAEYIVVPESNVWKNPSDMPAEVACVQEPFGNAVHTALSTELVAKKVLITGCGPIGLMAIAIAKAAGAEQVFATEVVPFRIQLAQAMGADLVLNPQETDIRTEISTRTRDTGVDVLLEMSGNSSAISEGFAVLRCGGYAALLGIPAEPLEMDLANAVIFKGATVYGVTGRLIWKTWYQAASLLGTGAVDVQPVITHRLPLEDFEQGMALMDSGQCGKVVLFP